MRSLLVLLSSLALAAAAGADQIVRTFSATNRDGNVFQSYDAFDPGLGTLTSVVIDFHATNSGAFEYLNRGAPAKDVTLETWSLGLLYIYHVEPDQGYGDIIGGVNALYHELHVADLGTGESLVSHLDYDGGILDSFGDSGSPGVFEGDALVGFLARYPGDQTRFQIAALTFHNASPLSSWTLTRDFDGRVGATVTYNYAPVPEPASMLALGLGALGLLRRRRKA